MSIDDYDLGYAVSAVETGTLNRSASILIQAGFNSRLAAIKAVTDTGATFESGQELRQWLASKDVVARSALADWPTVETKAMWIDFLQSFKRSDNRTWADRRYSANRSVARRCASAGHSRPNPRFSGRARVLAADGAPLGTLKGGVNPERIGLARAQVSLEAGRIDISYLRPEDFLSAASA